jgi:hypothetical protein
MTGELLFTTFKLIHFLGLAAMFGGAVRHWWDTTRRGNLPLLLGAVVQLATGSAMVMMREPNVDHAKIGVKLTLALAALVLAWAYYKKPMARPMALTVPALPTLALLVAGYWKFLPF